VGGLKNVIPGSVGCFIINIVFFEAMLSNRFRLEQFRIGWNLIRWTVLVIPVSVITGLLVAFFLWALEEVTDLRWGNLWLVWLLPVAGVLIYFLYRWLGKDSEAGNNLILDEIYMPGGGVPLRMAPLVLVTTLFTHLFGGSAGREGTAVQMGGSLASWLARGYRLRPADKRILLMSGMAAGFGAVFGTPVAGAIFALEVLAIGRIRYDALLPCLIAAVLADQVCLACGIVHTQYSIQFAAHTPEVFSRWFPMDAMRLGYVVMGGVAFGLAGFMFARLTHFIKGMSNRLIPRPWLVPVVGALLVIGISYAIGSFDYLGLGVTNPVGGVSILSAFEPGGAHATSWFVKLLLTAITLGMGFKGGEVTPLFFIGATLGNTVATLTGEPVDLFAALGFVAVFAGATNTPLACTLMGVELFGPEHVLYFAVACFTAYYFSGHSSIYGSQRVAINKFHEEETDGQRLGQRGVK